MRRLALVLVCLAPLAVAGDFGRTLRALRADDRERRRDALEAFAEGRQRPASRSEADKMEQALQRFLSDRFPGAERALAVRALGRLDRPRVYTGLLDRLREETDDRVLHVAESVFRRAPEPVLDGIVRLLTREKDPIRRAVLVRLMGAVDSPEARRRTRLRARMADHWCPRAAAVHALSRDRDPEAFPPLIELLETADPGLLSAAIESLTRLTGRRYGRDVVEWQTWWKARGEQAPLEPPPEKQPDDGRRRYAHEVESKPIPPYYFGIPVRGARIVFVFDVSGSMRYKLPLAYDQLTRAVKGLESTCRFEVIFFNEHVWPWRGRLSHADPVTKELLVRHLPTIEIKSYTNLFDSIEMALSLKVDEIFVISDGAPNRGRRRLPRDILNELRRINTAKTRIHTVSVVRVVDGDEHTALLKAIAEQHGGEHVARTLK